MASVGAGIVLLSCTPHYTDAAASWVTQDSQCAFSVWFNPAQGLMLEDLAKTIEQHAIEMADIQSQNAPGAKVKLNIQIQRFAIRGQLYARQYLPNYKAGDVLKDKEAFNVLVWQRAAVTPQCTIS